MGEDNYVLIDYVKSIRASFPCKISHLWANARNVRPYYPHWQYTDLFIFRFAFMKKVGYKNPEFKI